MKSFWAAVKFLTVFPWPRTVVTTPEDIGRSAAYFPVVGLCLGLILALLNRLLVPYVTAEILSVLLVTVMILMTRALHLDGLGDTFDGLGAKGGREDVMKVMRDSRVGIFGVLAVLIVVVSKIRAIEVMGEVRAQALVLAPILGRWVMVVLAYGSDAAREGLGQIMVEGVRGHHLLLATTITVILLFAVSGLTGLWIAFWVLLFALLSRGYLHRRLGGVTGDTFGAVGELTETFALMFFASI